MMPIESRIPIATRNPADYLGNPKIDHLSNDDHH